MWKLRKLKSKVEEKFPGMKGAATAFKDDPDILKASNSGSLKDL